MPLIFPGFGQLLAVLAAAIPSMFGRGGSNAQGQGVSGDIDPELMKELLAALGIDRRQSLRQSFLVDPQLAAGLGPEDLAQLGIDQEGLQSLLQGAVPLRSAANNLAFGLLPRFARDQNPQQALLNASPRTRVGRSGQVEPFDNDLRPTPLPKGNNALTCMADGGTPRFDPATGRFVECMMPGAGGDGGGNGDPGNIEE